MNISGHILYIGKIYILPIFPELEKYYDTIDNSSENNYSLLVKPFLKLAIGHQNIEKLSMLFMTETLEYLKQGPINPARLNNGKTQCKYMKITDTDYLPHKPCKGKKIICNNPECPMDIFFESGCNQNQCKFFTT